MKPALLVKFRVECVCVCVCVCVCGGLIEIMMGLGPLQSLQGSGPQPFWHQGPALWKRIFPRTRVGGMVLGWFKRIIFIVHFISSIIITL